MARHFSVSEDALGRHGRHMQIVIAKAAALVDQKDVSYGSALLAEIGRIRADAERLQLESERRHDVRGALRAIHERLAVVELEAKLSGKIDSSKGISRSTCRRSARRKQCNMRTIFWSCSATVVCRRESFRCQ